MVGQEFSAILDLRIDKAYSSFLTNTEKNRLIKEATVKLIQSKYAILDDQGDRDQLAALIKTNKVFIPASNQIYTNDAGIPTISDYNDLFAVKARFDQLILGLAITNATNASPILITFTGQNNLRSGELMTIARVIGNFAANGTYYIKRIKSTQFSLYSDKNLTVPVVGNGVYSSGGTISRVFYNYCQPVVSDKKIDKYAEATVRDPRFEIADNLIKITPSSETCVELTVDYLAMPSTFIDVADGGTDLELTYPLDFLYDLADETANLFAQAFKDGDLFQTTNFEMQKNSK